MAGVDSTGPRLGAVGWGGQYLVKASKSLPKSSELLECSWDSGITTSC